MADSNELFLGQDIHSIVRFWTCTSERTSLMIGLLRRLEWLRKWIITHFPQVLFVLCEDSSLKVCFPNNIKLLLSTVNYIIPFFRFWRRCALLRRILFNRSGTPMVLTYYNSLVALRSSVGKKKMLKNELITINYAVNRTQRTVECLQKFGFEGGSAVRIQRKVSAHD